MNVPADAAYGVNAAAFVALWLGGKVAYSPTDSPYTVALIRRSCDASAAGLILNSQLSYGALFTASGVSTTFEYSLR